jgi:hypothetical protein
MPQYPYIDEEDCRRLKPLSEYTNFPYAHILSPHAHTHIRCLKKFANSPQCACRSISGQKPQYDLMTLAYQRFTAVFLLIYGSLFLSGVYYCLECVLMACTMTMHLLTALSVREFLASKQITVSEHPPYSPSPQWLFSVPEDKGNVERKTFWWHWWLQE